eukprot:scaffold34637_cov187-Amphora_coffeaeformis.AAC.7
MADDDNTEPPTDAPAAATAAASTLVADATAVSSSSPVADDDDDDIEQHPEYWRYHIPRDRFAWLYKHINELGWEYNATTGHYRAPTRPDGTPGRVFDSAASVTDYINSFALPNIYTNLQWGNDNNTGEESLQEREIGLALRKAIFQRSQQKKENILDDDRFGLSSSDSEEDATKASNKNKNGKGARRSTRTVAGSRTVTAMEKGADLYLRKRTTKGVSKKKKSAMAAAAAPSKAKSRSNERLSLKECREFVENYPLEDVENYERAYQAQFPRWRFILSTNHSLLFYGAGSKRELLNTFANEELQKEGESLVIDGTDEELTIQGLLDVLVHVFLQGDEPTDLSTIPCQPDNVPVTAKFCPWKANPVVERAIMIGRGLAHLVESSTQPIPPSFLVIHSLDARLATSVAQEALAALITNSTVSNGVASLRVVASVDHVDAPTFLWDAVTEANFSWFPCCVHTHRPYVRELNLIDEDGAYRKKTARTIRSNTQEQRVLDVLRNLAPRHTEVVQLLAQLQANNKEWVDYLEYRDRCKKACAINKESQLRSLLTELKDHGLVISKTEASNEFVQIPFSAEKLQEIIDFERDG